jgi:WD40 repeat protein
VSLDGPNGPDWKARVWELATGEPLSEWTSKEAARAAGPGQTAEAPERPGLPSHLAFTPDGRSVILLAGVGLFEEADRPHGEATVWDAASGRLVARLEHHGLVTCVASSASGDRIVTGGVDRIARVWDAATGEPVTPPLTHTDAVHAASFSPDGSMVLTAGADGAARVWSARWGEPITPPLKHGDQVLDAAFARDGGRMVTAGLDGTVRIWELGADSRPVADLVDLAGLLAGHQLDATGGTTPLDAKALQERWRRLREKYPE